MRGFALIDSLFALMLLSVALTELTTRQINFERFYQQSLLRSRVNVLAAGFIDRLRYASDLPARKKACQWLSSVFNEQVPASMVPSFKIYQLTTVAEKKEVGCATLSLLAPNNQLQPISLQLILSWYEEDKKLMMLTWILPR